MTIQDTLGDGQAALRRRFSNHVNVTGNRRRVAMDLAHSRVAANRALGPPPCVVGGAAMVRPWNVAAAARTDGGIAGAAAGPTRLRVPSPLGRGAAPAGVAEETAYRAGRVRSVSPPAAGAPALAPALRVGMEQPGRVGMEQPG